MPPFVNKAGAATSVRRLKPLLSRHAATYFLWPAAPVRVIGSGSELHSFIAFIVPSDPSKMESLEKTDKKVAPDTCNERLCQTVTKLYIACSGKYKVRNDIKQLVIEAYHLVQDNIKQQPTLSASKVAMADSGTQTSHPTPNPKPRQDQLDHIINQIKESILTELPRLVAGEINHLIPHTAARAINPPSDNSETPTMSYAHAAASPRQRLAPTQPARDHPAAKTPLSKPTIVLKLRPKAPTTTDLLATFRREVSFKTRSYAPTRIRQLPDKSLKVEFDTKSAAREINTLLQKSEVLESTELKRRNPMIILKGVSDLIKDKDIIAAIQQQNPSVPFGTLTLKFKKPNRNPGRFNAVLETSPAVFHSMLSLERVNIDHERVRVAEYLPFVQCYKCLAFGHFQGKCESQSEICAHCASPSHAVRNCPHRLDTPSCHNCTKHNKASDSTTVLTAPHSATSPSCPQIKYMFARIRSNICYE